MTGIKDQVQIENMRRRLYERGQTIEPEARHDLSKQTHLAPTTWDIKRNDVRQNIPEDPRSNIADTDELPVISDIEPVAREAKRKYSYRTIILLVSLGVFFVVAVFSILYSLFGNNQISNHNISVALTGPLTVGGGEVIPLQATVTNLNRVPIDSATLIVRFPAGAKAADGSGRDILEERISLETIEAGETLNMPVRVIVFGEENQEREINAEIEYRLQNSNGTFYKRADPFTFSIHSSPLVVRANYNSKVSSGQTAEITLEIQSNASAPLRNILVSTEYPINYEFTSANPAPSFRQNTWLISEIAPEQVVPISIRGVVVGNQNEEFVIPIAVGTARQDNQFVVGAMLANATVEMIIERPFIDVRTSINNSSDPIVVTPIGNTTAVAIEVRNTLTEPIYDMAVEVSVSGNVLARDQVIVQNGFYDSIKDVVRFEVSGDPRLAEVSPNDTRRFSFSIIPNEERYTPTFEVETNVFARRVAENRVTEQLIGSTKNEVRYTAQMTVLSGIEHISGPVPPIADQATNYRVTLVTRAGGNDVTGAVLTTSIPQFVAWQANINGDGDLIFNPVSKEITWNIGNITADQEVRTSFDISLTPSQAQINSVPALLGASRLRATDRFSGAVVRAESPPRSANLPEEAGFGRESGRVRRAVVESGD